MFRIPLLLECRSIFLSLPLILVHEDIHEPEENIGNPSLHNIVPVGTADKCPAAMNEYYIFLPDLKNHSGLSPLPFECLAVSDDLLHSALDTPPEAAEMTASVLHLVDKYHMDPEQ